MTKSGIEPDLRVTPYVTTITYGEDHSISYMFSSKTVQAKFEEEVYAYRREVTESLTNRFRMKFCISNDICDINLYRKLERRGFYIVVDGSEVKWLGEVQYNGVKVTMIN